MEDSAINLEENEHYDLPMEYTDNGSEEGDINRGDTIQVDAVLNYTMMKRIPVDVPIVTNLVVQNVIPEEESCRLCGGLLTRILCSNNGKQVTMCNIITGNNATVD